MLGDAYLKKKKFKSLRVAVFLVSSKSHNLVNFFRYKIHMTRPESVVSLRSMNKAWKVSYGHVCWCLFFNIKALLLEKYQF